MGSERRIRRGWWLLLALLMAAPVCAQTITYFDTGEEFVGPFPSWRNVKTYYGAKGDGVADDTAALQRALNDMKTVQTNDWCVLYFPAGTYRITDTLTTSPLRKTHNDFLGANLIGEDPTTTTLSWDGPADKPMLRYDAWYCKVSRLTFDGHGKANCGLLRAGGFSTYCEISDLIFKDINGIALNLGNAEREGQAEHAVLRCAFLRCTEGISTINWNTLDIYVWYCLFEDCGTGIYNRTGGFQAYANVFLRTKDADLIPGSADVAVVNNLSIGSKTFLKDGYGGLYLRGNRIYDTVDSVAIAPGGNLVMLDNTVVGKPGRTDAVMTLAPSSLLVGNTFTTAWPVRPGPVRFNHADGGSYVVGHALENVLDPNPGTSFRTGMWEKRPPGVAWLCPTGAPVAVVRYALTSAADTEASDDPKNFQLRGSDDWGHSWTVLDDQQNHVWANRGERQAFTLAAPRAFALYQLIVTETQKGTKPGVGGFMALGKFELLDAKGRDLTKDPAGLLSAAQETWGNFYQIDQKIVASEKLPAPPQVRLPGTPPNRHRKVFEVRAGTGDDAQELQAQIAAAAKEPIGSKPVVHVPKGNLTLKRTVTIPAGCDMQLLGDGVGNGTALNYGGGDGPLLRLQGPSRATLRDLDLNGGNQNGVDGIVVENADQDGGRVYGNQLNAHGFGGPHMCGSAVCVQGLDRSDVTMICGGLGNCLNGVNVRGGAKLAAGGVTPNQVAFLTGGTGAGCRLLNATDGGKLVGEAFWYEGDWDYAAALLDLTAPSSGKISAAAIWWHMDSKKQPMVAMDGFNGLCTIVGSNLDNRNSAHLQLKGEGAKAALFCAGTWFTAGGGPGPKLEDAWVDQTAPAAQAVMFACNDANLANQDPNRLPDADFVRRALDQLRAVRIDLPTDLPQGVTDVKLFRVQITGGDGKDGLRVEAGK